MPPVLPVTRKTYEIIEPPTYTTGYTASVVEVRLLPAAVWTAAFVLGATGRPVSGSVLLACGLFAISRVWPLSGGPSLEVSHQRID